MSTQLQHACSDSHVPLNLVISRLVVSILHQPITSTLATKSIIKKYYAQVTSNVSSAVEADRYDFTCKLL